MHKIIAMPKDMIGDGEEDNNPNRT